MNGQEAVRNNDSLPTESVDKFVDDPVQPVTKTDVYYPFIKVIIF